MTVMSDRPVDSERAPLAATVIGWAGVIPFVVGAVGPMVIGDLGTAAFIAFATSVYGALVLSFLGGIRWGMAMSPLYGSARTHGFVLSIVPPIAAWAALILSGFEGQAVLIAAFVLQAWLDVKAVGEGRAPLWFAPLRVRLTAAAIVALLVTAVVEMAVISV
ncbi:DUF3429 domain-containing protein [Microbaculum marinum]|uniref:DUF3429 domain-containing protein n=1 Tax=Microbaculum marinum TaxID=1764581 RepID=A0AAW9RBT8_9HYPH